jgi:hypothetical protein
MSKKADLEKRFRGLHYEVGSLPEFLAGASWYWNLPHAVRRSLFFVLAPRNMRRVKRLRHEISRNINTPSLKPFFDTRSVFVHIPKTAGISVGMSLYGRKSGDHRTIRDYELCFRKSDFDSFFKFAFVRNPWDRLFSAYSFLERGGRNEHDVAWAKTYLDRYDHFGEFVKDWVNQQNVRLGLHFRPQLDFLCGSDGRIGVDFIGHFENIDEDYEKIRRRIGAGGALEAANVTKGERRDYRDFYDERSKAIVAEVYRPDIELLGYTFDGFTRLPRTSR